MEALKALYGIMCSLLEELLEIDLLFRIETDAQTPGRMDEATGEFRKFDADVLKKRIVPEHTKRILALQKSRKELQRLPKFPDADLTAPLILVPGRMTRKNPVGGVGFTKRIGSTASAHEY